MRARRISILGATGSVGLATLDLIGRAEAGRYEIVALTANSNAEGLAELAKRYRPEVAVIADPSQFGALQDALAGTGIECTSGPEALVEAASRHADWVMAAIVGAAGLAPTLAALAPGRVVALANKECLVCSGDLFMSRARDIGATVLPVDSEHNALFQALDESHRGHVDCVTLTASGGPFRTWTLEDMARATREDALAHPVWSMGAKISIDSATLMNKGLEVIEACRLFDLRSDQVKVVVHPQSIIHGLVEYSDGSVLAQLGSPDMRIPIASALAWPERMRTPAERLDLAKIAKLDFERPDEARFPALALARTALMHGEGMTSALNAANEIAVETFLNGHIGFLDMIAVVSESLDEVDGAETLPKRFADIDEAIATDLRTRDVARGVVKKLTAKRA